MVSEPSIAAFVVSARVELSTRGDGTVVDLTGEIDDEEAVADAHQGAPDDLPFDEFFPNQVLKMVIRQPLLLTETAEKFDILVNVDGGGPTGQAGAIRHGITRALIEFDADLRPALKKAGFVRRDPRKKERKKYGQAGARKRFQFSKR